MKILVRSSLCLCLTACALLAQGTPERWLTFTSSTGFSVKYPASWFPKGTAKDRLMILSSRGGAEALIIQGGQAVITVRQADRNEGSSLTQIIDYYNQNVDVLLRQDIRNENPGSRGCRELREIESKEAAVPPEDVPGPVPYIVNTDYFCEVNKHVYVTVLRNFYGDNKQSAYQKIALRIAESLRSLN